MMVDYDTGRKARELGEVARTFMKKRSQLIEVLWSGRELIVSAPAFESILPSLKSTDWYRAVEGEAPAGVCSTLLELIEMLCALPREEREDAIQRARSILYGIQKEQPLPL